MRSKKWQLYNTRGGKFISVFLEYINFRMQISFSQTYIKKLVFVMFSLH